MDQDPNGEFAEVLAKAFDALAVVYYEVFVHDISR